MFTDYPAYSVYRTLRLLDPQMSGEDVYALQIGLNAVKAFNVPLVPDGVLGIKTSKAIVAVQKELRIVADGLAGQKTQEAIAQRISKIVKLEIPLPTGLPYGQLAHESSFFLGNYSAQRGDGSYDAGIAQMNTKYTNPKDAFHPAYSIRTLCQHVYGSYQRYSSVTDKRRRWELAAGSWNAPYYANWLAGVKPSAEPGPTARQLLEDYMKSVTAYLELS